MNTDEIYKIVLKHLGGQHNQKRHGWRYGSYGKSVSSLRKTTGAEDQSVYRQRAGLPSKADIAQTKKPYTPAQASKKLEPKGVPVSSVLKYPKKGEAGSVATEVISAINSVHGDGDILKTVPGGNPIEVKFDKSTKHGGAYYHTDDGAARITVSRFLTSKEYQMGALAHEIGHMIDFKGGALKNAKADTLKKLSDALENSDAYKTLKDMQNNPTKYVRKVEHQNYTSTLTPSSQMTSYYLKGTEAFARAYSQYIAVKSGNKSIMAGIRESDGVGSAYAGFVQWKDKDFEPIAKAMDDLFVEIGWMG